MAAVQLGRNLRPLLTRTRSLSSIISLAPRLRYSTSEEVTHTGQAFSDEDFRRARFIDKKKVVNPNFSERLIAEEAPIEIDARVVSCNGGGGALGHPKVYINLDQPGPHPCGYCGLRFVRKGH